MKNSQQPAFSSAYAPSNDWGGHYEPGLTKLEQTCIQLGVAKTGDPELDAIIREANRRELAAKAMNGLLAANATYNGKTNDRVTLAKDAIATADALLAELDGNAQKNFRATQMFTLLKRINQNGLNDELSKEVKEFVERQESTNQPNPKA